jgi:hypothetical protein
MDAAAEEVTTEGNEIEEALKLLADDEIPEELKEPEKEKPKEEPKKEPEKKEDDKLSKRFAALSRKEKEIQEERKKIEEERRAFESERKEIQGKLTEATKAQDILRIAQEDPISFLRETGISFDKLADAMLNDDGTLKTQSELAKVKKEMDEKIEALRKEREDEKKTAQTQQEEKELREKEYYIAQQIENFRQGMNQTIESKPDDYELILANQAQDSVWSVIENFFYETGEILQPEVAAEYVEKQLLEQAQKLLSTKKLATGSKVAVRDKIKDVQDKPRPSRTLTNGSAIAATIDEDTDSLDDGEAFRRALSLL